MDFDCHCFFIIMQSFSNRQFSAVIGPVRYVLASYKALPSSLLARPQSCGDNMGRKTLSIGRCINHLTNTAQLRTSFELQSTPPGSHSNLVHRNVRTILHQGSSSWIPQLDTAQCRLALHCIRTSAGFSKQMLRWSRFIGHHPENYLTRHEHSQIPMFISRGDPLSRSLFLVALQHTGKLPEIREQTSCDVGLRRSTRHHEGRQSDIRLLQQGIPRLQFMG